jgi:hypothetical protein
MIVRDLYRLGTVGRPVKTDAPLSIHAYGILAATIAFQCLQPVTGRRKQIIQAGCGVHHIELAQRDGFDIPPARRTDTIAKQPLSGFIGKAAYHENQYAIRITYRSRAIWRYANGHNRAKRSPDCASGHPGYRIVDPSSPNKKPRHRCRGFALLSLPERLDQKSMPPMPPPPGGIPPPPEFFFGSSAIMASVVIRRAATEAAFWIAARTTLVGSMMPFLTMSP